MEKHIKEGKGELNFNEWTSYSSRKQRNKLNAMIGQIEKDKMPLKPYTLIHKNARLKKEQTESLIKWLDQLK